MKVFALYTGEYEARLVHSLHTRRADAEAVDALVRRDWHDRDAPADIEEYEIDPVLCAVCGYDEDLHINTEAFPHPFTRLSGPRGDSRDA